MMKKLSMALVAALWASSAFAGSWHQGKSLICSDCHTMHASRSHTFGNLAAGTDLLIGSPTPASPWLANGGVGNEYLLVAGGVNETCLACHDGVAGIPDVMGANVNGNQRPAGRLNEETDAATVQQTGHTMGLAFTVNPPGWLAFGAGQLGDVWTNTSRGFAAEFECDDCHKVHGAPSYRNVGNTRGRNSKNLGFSSTTWGLAPTYSYNATSPGAGNMLVPARFDTDVVIVPNASGLVGRHDAGDNYNSNEIAFTVANGDATVVNYVQSFNATTGANIYYSGTFAADQNGSTAGKNKMNGFCATCHGNFHGDSNTSLTPTTGKFKKHPTTGVANATSVVWSPVAKNAVKLVYGSATSFEAGCLSCHKAHGTTNQFGLIIPADKSASSTAWANLDADLENGDGAATGTIGNLCKTCHSMGRTGSSDTALP